MKYKVKEEVFDIDLEEKKICLDSNSGKYLAAGSLDENVYIWYLKFLHFKK